MPMGADPEMAVVRVKAPADVDPYVLEAELTRAVAGSRARPMTAELTLLPSVRRSGGRFRRHLFVALLCTPTARPADELAAAVQKTLRKSLRRRFGADASAKVRPPRSGDEIDVCWLGVRGTPHRQQA
ncbi:hypothetical protein BJF78_11415 [Pseudonocardia sp. CNS-139]|nr:hypothetical protein BJF78_11415 [Pseudonocardia sp. CNS-139]